MLEDLLRVVPVEWRPAAQQDVHDDAAGPDVRLLAVLPAKHLVTREGGGSGGVRVSGLQGFRI